MPTIYDVGPGLALTTVGAVPWNSLQAGDVVNIHWQANPYHEKIILSNSGTAGQHIVINGIAGPQGQLPILDGANASSSPHAPQFSYTPLQDFGLIVIFRDQAKPAGYQPSYIDINNLQLQGAVGGASFTGYAGDSRTYTAGASGIWTEGASHLTIHGCTVTNNDNGIFAKSAGDTTYDITLDSNYLYGNGVAGSFLYHNSYLEAYGALYQYNHYGPLRAGAIGDALKDRSSSTVIRYNYIIDGGHILDLDEPQDGYDVISTDPNYLQTLVYGNVLVSDANGPTLLVHYGDGGGSGQYRNGGVLYFYNNTVINQEDQFLRWYTIVFQMDVSTVSVDARNNIFFNTSQTLGADPTILEFGLADGNINFPTANWVSPGWLPSQAAQIGESYNGTITGTNNFFVDPENNPGFANPAAGDARLLTGSGAIGRSGALASVPAASYPLANQYVYNQGSQPRPTTSDLGAFAYLGSLAVSTSAPTTSAGSAFQVTVTAKDALGNTAGSYSGTVHFTSSDGQAVLPADYTFTAADGGVHTFTVTLKTAGTETITVADKTAPSLTSSGSVTVSPAAASQLTVSGFPISVPAGAAATATVTAEDPYGNIATGYAGSVHFTSSDAQAVLPANYTFTAADAGVHTFSVTLKTAGANVILVTDTSSSSITGSANLAVSPAAASQLIVSGFPPSVTAGTAGTVIVAAEDAYGNLVTSYAGTVHFSSTDPQAGLPANYTFVGADKGSHAFSVTLKTAGTQGVTATDQSNASITGSQSGIVVAGPLIVDNGGAGYSETGTWTTETVPSYGGSERYAASGGTGQNAATWQVTQPSGSYQVQVSWHPYPNQSTNAPYAIYDGTTLLQTVLVNQTQAANGTSYGGVPFQTLATVNITSGTLKVMLSNTGNGTYIVADAMRVAPVTVSGTDLNWSGTGDGISGPATATTQTPFTMSRSCTVSAAAAPGNFAIAYYASTSSSLTQDLGKATLLGTETLSAATDVAVGDHGGTSPALLIPSGGTYYLFARLMADPSWIESNQTNNVAMAAQPVQVSGPVIVDNGDPGYSESGTWATETVPSYNGSERYATSSGTGQNTATWQMTGLASGPYQVQVTWHRYPNQATNAPYAIYDGSTLLQTVLVDQTQSPNDSSYGGAAFQTLATVNITSGTLKVVLSNTGKGTYIVADAMRVAPVTVSNTDLNWSGTADGISGPATATTRTAFTMSRSYTVSAAAAPGNFAIAYYASTSSSLTQDLGKATLLGTETLSAAAAVAVGDHSGTSPTLLIPSGGTYYLFARLMADPSWIESNQSNNVAMAAQPVQVSGPVIVDNGDPGYSETGTWATEAVPSYNGSERYATSSGTGQNTATWQMTGLASGPYQVQVTWHRYPNQATNAPYAIYDGSTLLQTVLVDQTQSPNDSSYGGAAFQTLATVNITSGTLKVVLNNTGNGTYVVADAVLYWNQNRK